MYFLLIKKKLSIINLWVFNESKSARKYIFENSIILLKLFLEHDFFTQTKLNGSGKDRTEVKIYGFPKLKQSFVIKAEKFIGFQIDCQSIPI
jgi:hypothetical protein